jgi:hypothetical protein
MGAQPIFQYGRARFDAARAPAQPTPDGAIPMKGFLIVIAALVALPATTRAQDIKPVQAQEVKPVQAQDIKPVQAQAVRPAPARGAAPRTAGGVKPVQSQEVRPVAPADEVKLRKPAGPPTCAASAPAGTPAPDARVAGTWAMIVPGVAYTQEDDRGSYIERVQRVGVGAPAGALTITRDGRFTWQKKSGRYTGKLGWCTTTNGQGGWTVRDDRERFFVGYLEGTNGGFYLFSTVTGDYVFKGQPVR